MLPVSMVRSPVSRGRKALPLWLVLVAYGLADLLLAPSVAEARPEAPTEPATPAWETAAGELRLAQRRRRRRRPRRRRPRRPPPAPEPAADQEESKPSAATPAATPDSGALQRGARVEFDGRLVQGQTAKSGAIYLFARRRSELRSMVKERENYRKEILRTVYPEYDGKR